MAPPLSQPNQPHPLNRMGILKPQDRLESDFAPSFNAWKASPDPANLSSLLTTVNPIIDRAVKHYAPDGGVNARGQAKQLVIGALGSYDPKKGTLGAHLWSNLQRLQRQSASARQIISLPEQVAVQKSQLDAAEQELEDKLERMPSEQELADALRISPKRLAYIRQAGVPVAASRFGDDSPASSPQAVEGQKAWEDFVYGSLSGTDQSIMDHLIGRGRQQLSGVELAKRLRITPSAVSQRASRIQKLLSSREEYGIF